MLNPKHQNDSLLLECLRNEFTYNNSYTKIADIWVRILDELKNLEELERFFTKSKDAAKPAVAIRALQGYSKVCAHLLKERYERLRSEGATRPAVDSDASGATVAELGASTMPSVSSPTSTELPVSAPPVAFDTSSPTSATTATETSGTVLPEDHPMEVVGEAEQASAHPHSPALLAMGKEPGDVKDTLGFDEQVEHLQGRVEPLALPPSALDEQQPSAADVNPMGPGAASPQLSPVGTPLVENALSPTMVLSGVVVEVEHCPVQELMPGVEVLVVDSSNTLPDPRAESAGAATQIARRRSTKDGKQDAQLEMAFDSLCYLINNDITYESSQPSCTHTHTHTHKGTVQPLREPTSLTFSMAFVCRDAKVVEAQERLLIAAHKVHMNDIADLPEEYLHFGAEARSREQGDSSIPSATESDSSNGKSEFQHDVALERAVIYCIKLFPKVR